MSDDEIRTALGQLDGTTRSAVALLSGLSAERLDELGGLPDDVR